MQMHRPSFHSSTIIVLLIKQPSIYISNFYKVLKHNILDKVEVAY